MFPANPRFGPIRSLVIPRVGWKINKLDRHVEFADLVDYVDIDLYAVRDKLPCCFDSRSGTILAPFKNGSVNHVFEAFAPQDLLYWAL
jgi:hypothetical protein